MQRYNPKDIEPKWQKKWQKDQTYAAVDFDERPKYVMLTEFPYPSGSGLHLGHIREYTYGDIMARHKRMQGYNVLFPMGYDAFGLPTENYAIKNKISPQKATADSVAYFQSQLESLGYSIDWSRAVQTTDPEYYKWTQWLFLQFFKEEMAYQDEIAINWCPHCKTGLANEEVVSGRHERCDTLVEKKLLKQWMLRIIDYADRLIEGLKDVDYPSRIADQQINWIGKSEGVEIDFYDIDDNKDDDPITVFTTRPDTFFGATFLVLAPEHPAVQRITRADHRDSVNSYIKTAQSKSDIERQETREKTGVFTGGYAPNPVTGESMPIWVADYVLMGYGTGAIMAVPAHDERDWEFAKQHDLSITRVIDTGTPEGEVATGEGTTINSGDFDGLNSTDAKAKITEFIEKEGWGRAKTQYRLRDWIFSRQHYWGEPIPIIHCETDGAVAVPEDQLPVTLPPVEHYEPTDTGESPLSEITDWVNTECPKCGKPAKRETDTMPNWAGSSWYYLRYYDAKNDKAFADRKKLEYWGAVDMYLGGMEHTTLHLLYSRFWHQFLYDQGLVPTPEPYVARRGQGIILAADGFKMSKSRGNIVNPTDIIESGYGADALRLAISFLAPYDQTTPWSPEGVAGTHRLLMRTWTLVDEYLAKLEAGESETESGALEADILRVTHQAIKKVSSDLDKMNFNTAIAALMEYVNNLYKLKEQDEFTSLNVWRTSITSLLQLLAPFAPHLAEELWQQVGYEESVHFSEWPKFDEQYLVQQMITIAIQINGKIRGEVEVAHDTDQETIIEAAKLVEKVAGYLKDQEIKKSIYVPGKLVSFVI